MDALLTRFGRFLRDMVRTPFATAMGILGVTTMVRAFTDPESFTLYLFIGAFSYVWAVIYGTGGAMMLYGMGAFNAKWEATGCVLFGQGALAQAIATGVFVHRSPFLTWYGVFALSVFAWAAFLRASHLVKGQRLAWVESNGVKP